jgi:heptose-I-phosphate ethanolaminephosphotransferase
LAFRSRQALGALALVVLAIAGWQVAGVLAAWRELRAIAGRLPALPPLAGLTQASDPGFPVKVWLHRVDSIERAVRMARAYAGMEIDVVFDSAAGYFDVGHPPLPPSGISLDSLLGAIPAVDRHYFWIDFKNLTDGNAPAACENLRGVARRRGLVGHLIVESPNPQALTCFTAAGFYTSYYLFPEQGIETMDEAGLRRYYEEVRRDLAASRVNAVSSSFESLPFIEAYLPGTDALLWYLDHDRNLRHRAVLAYLTRRPHVRVVLERKLSRGYR